MSGGDSVLLSNRRRVCILSLPCLRLLPTHACLCARLYATSTLPKIFACMVSVSSHPDALTCFWASISPKVACRRRLYLPFNLLNASNLDDIGLVVARMRTQAANESASAV